MKSQLVILTFLTAFALLGAYLLVAPEAEAAAPSPEIETGSCFVATLIIDQNCDDEGDIGWNESTSSAGACWDAFSEMISEASANYECWWPQVPNCIETSCLDVG